MSQKWVSLPGGGGFCLIQAFLLSQVDLSDVAGYMGTSGGSINGAYLALDMPASELPDRYIEFADAAFHKPFWYRMNIFKCEHDDKGLNNSLQDMFGGTTMGQVSKHMLIIPASDFLDEKPKVFDNLVDRDDRDVELWTIVRDSCGAPTYYPIRDISIDGGLWANDPARAGLDTIKTHRTCPLEDIHLLTVGSGYFARRKYIREQLRDWSRNKLNWIKPLVSRGITGWNEKATHFSVKAEPLGYYQKYNPVVLNPGWEMNDSGVVRELYKQCIADQKLIDEFKRTWEKFMLT
jgi:patatin-like phospholipase/acyl hydrolase